MRTGKIYFPLNKLILKKKNEENGQLNVETGQEGLITNHYYLYGKKETSFNLKPFSLKYLKYTIIVLC